MSTIERLLRGKLLADRYRLNKTIGVGGMGAVFLATDERLQRRVAVKIIQLAGGSAADHAHLRKRFHREAQVLARLHHRNVVTVHDFGTDLSLELDFLVMELLDGQDLSAYLTERGVPPLPAALEILRQAARGLAGGHREGLVHRDVKPGNLFLVDEDDPDDIQVRVLDFGIVQLTQSDLVTATGTALTRRGFQPGTLRYMSPEQRRGAPMLTPASDVYSLGVVGFELLTGNEPLSDWDRERVSQGLTVPVPSVRTRLPDIPPVVDELIQRSLQLDPKSRFQSAAEFEVALRAAIRFVSSAGPALRGDAHPPNDSRGSAGALLRDRTGSSNPPPWAPTPFENEEDVTTDVGIAPDQNQDSSTGAPYANIGRPQGQPEVNNRFLPGTDVSPAGGAAKSIRTREIKSRLPLVLVVAAVMGIAGVAVARVFPGQDAVLTDQGSEQPTVSEQLQVVDETPGTLDPPTGHSEPAERTRTVPPRFGSAEQPRQVQPSREPQPRPQPLKPHEVQQPNVAEASPGRPVPEKATRQAGQSGTGALASRPASPSQRTAVAGRQSPVPPPTNVASRTTSVQRPNVAEQRTTAGSPQPPSPAAPSTPPPLSVAEPQATPSLPAEPSNADLSKIGRYLTAGQALQRTESYREAAAKYDSASAHLAELSRRFAGSEKIQNLRADVERAKTRNRSVCRALQKLDESPQCP